MKTLGWIVAAVLVVLLGIEELRLQKLRQQLAGMEPTTPVAADASAGTGSSDVVADAPPPRSGDRPDKPKPSELESSEREFGTTMRKMAENPVTQSMMNQGVKAMVGVMYADLIEKFGLTEEEADYFLALKASVLSSQQQLGMRIMGAKDATEREAIMQEIEDSKKENEDAIKEFLNSDADVATYETFEKRLPERQQLDGIRGSFSAAGTPLRPEQEAELIDAMYTARTTQPHLIDWNGTKGMDAIASGEASERFKLEWDQRAEHTAAAVAPVLDEAQMDAFRTYQEQMRDMQLMGLEMAEKMFKSQDGGGN